MKEYSDNLLRRAEKIAELGYWKVDLIQDTLFWSEQVYKIHGITQQSYSPTLESAIDFYHPDDTGMVKNHLDKTIANKSDFTFKARIQRPCGEIRNVLSSGECEVNENGEVIGLFGIFRDITEETKTHQKTIDENIFLSTIYENIPDYLFVKDADFKILSANSAFIGLYPQDMQNKIIGYTTVEEYKPEEAEQFLKQDKIAFDTGYSETEESVTFPDGQKRTLLTKKIRFQDADNNPCILGIARDITQIKEAHKKLFEAEVTNKSYSDAANDGYWDWLIQDDYEYMSPRFWEMFGYTPEEKEHHPKEWQSIIFKEDLETALENFEKHVQTKGQFPFEQEVRYYHKDGSVVNILCKGKVVQWDKNDAPIRVIGTHTDITELKRTQKALEELNAELEEFAYRTSHDLRSPLISSLGLLDIVDTALNEKDIETAKTASRHINSSLTKLEKLVADILDLTRTKNKDEDKKIVSLDDIIEQSVSKLSNMKNFDRLEISTNVKDTPKILCQESRLTLVIENLISNAVKYQDPEKNNAYLKIKAKEHDENLSITFTDNGIGIPEEQEDQIFSMFKRFHPKTSFGSGLGLYMIKKSMDILKGQISYERTQDGSRFIIEIPIKR